MGCDIHSICEVYENGSWVEIYEPIFKSYNNQLSYSPFTYGRSYSLFAWLANVRNYSAIEPLAQPRGFPEDFDIIDIDIYECHSYSYFLLSELLNVDYSEIIEDRRSGNQTLPKGSGKFIPLKEYLPASYFNDLDAMKYLPYKQEHIRVTVWFDN